LKIRIEPIKKPVQEPNKAQPREPKPIRTGIRAGKPVAIVVGT